MGARDHVGPGNPAGGGSRVVLIGREPVEMPGRLQEILRAYPATQHCADGYEAAVAVVEAEGAGRGVNAIILDLDGLRLAEIQRLAAFGKRTAVDIWLLPMEGKGPTAEAKLAAAPLANAAVARPAKIVPAEKPRVTVTPAQVREVTAAALSPAAPIVPTVAPAPAPSVVRMPARAEAAPERKNGVATADATPARSLQVSSLVEKVLEKGMERAPTTAPSPAAPPKRQLTEAEWEEEFERGARGVAEAYDERGLQPVLSDAELKALLGPDEPEKQEG